MQSEVKLSELDDISLWNVIHICMSHTYLHTHTYTERPSER